ncbi:hypothetical protein GCM10007382_04390 [Salinibacterium xinjiangense]|uniref:Uncharacterized protein n=1 Tax=Salinibacterium xinjiangense TaxID=386302 RepID=A0A2C8ZLB5_9MICO|nr:hypothetical protein [Salinibacterium xinjiangense]GGK87593.1 hypothetical protein GCM10007382_04390 [Salinibacterium xinjiangense]SOE65711.1 hypothetical protein SAMN06296378_1604 [Salinibacterium xinjiangense]
MTTFHESQPQSRRAARESERGESTEQAEFTNGQPDAPQAYSPDASPPAARNETRGNAETTDKGSAPRGRRAAASAGPPSAVTEQIAIGQNATTQIATTQIATTQIGTEQNATKQADAPGTVDSVVTTPGLESFPPTQAIAQADRPAYRVRDYSPEGRRSSAASAAPWLTAVPVPAPSEVSASAVDDALAVTPFSPPAASALAGARPQFFVPESALQDTIVPAAVAAMPEAVAVEQVDIPVAPVLAILEFAIPEYTMTRRELRALEAQQLEAQQLEAQQRGSQNPPRLPEFAPDGSLTGAAAAVFVETTFNDENDSEALIETTSDAEPKSSEGTNTPPPLVDPPAPAAPAGSIDEVAADDAAAVDEVPFTAPALTPFDSLFQVPSGAPRAAPSDLLPPFRDAPGAEGRPAPLIDPPLPAVAPAADESPALADAMAKFDALTREAADDARAESKNAGESVAAAGSHWTPPAGHWSAQDEVDEDAPGEGTISRTVGSGISTTNALVLPSIPDGADIRGPLTGAGEIMLTGSVDLPRNLSSNGQSDRFDGDNMDALYDLNDAEVISTDSSPVRAIRAVSTHASAHGVTHTQKPKGTRALTGLLIAASSLAVVVAGLLVAAFAFNVF